MRLNQMQRMDPIQFEKFVGQLFRKMGLRVQGTRASADEGIDLILKRGRKQAIVQCKRYQGSVGQPVVRDLYGAMLHTESVEAYLVTTGTVTRSARSWVEDKPIHLVDGHRLIEWVRNGRLNYDRPPILRRRSKLQTATLTMASLLLLYFAFVWLPQNEIDAGELWRQITGADQPIPVTVEPTPALTPDDSALDSNVVPTHVPSPSTVQSPTSTPLPLNRDPGAPTE